MNKTVIELLHYLFFDDIKKKKYATKLTFHRRIYKPNQILLKGGEFSEGVGIIDSGVANAFLKYGNGRSEWFCDLSKSDLFGEISMLNKQPSVLEIICSQRIECYYLLADDIDPDINMFFYQRALDKLSKIVDKMCRYSPETGMPIGNEQTCSQYIQKAIEYIDKHYDSLLSLDILSLKIGVSKYNLSRNFKHNTGLSFTQYLNHRRIIEAKRIMLDPDVSVSQACYAVGFNELSHFSRVFKQFERTSPSRFKRMVGEACEGDK